ncbi:MAG: cyanophycinase [Saprospiraceae bacterium]|nr:cyanophycinase [Saprospiraceae bacterium]
MKENIILLLLLFCSIWMQAQGYQSWLTGNSNDFEADHEQGLVLAGGGTDNDYAMQWMLENAKGGDVVILRTTGSDGYNSYFFSELGVTLNSVESIRIDNREGANNDYVAQRIRAAEVLFIAGGDQTTYYDNWINTKVHEAILYVMNEKNACIGGTSAGMAVLSEFFYVPSGSSLVSAEALANPYHPNSINVRSVPFISHPLLGNTITDTHFDNRTRAGRTVSFLARMAKDSNVNPRGIACNERTAVCVTADGNARVFGINSNPNTFAYFIQTNCNLPESLPENCEPDEKLHWVKENEALKVYRIKGDQTGSNTFNISSWLNGEGGEWYHWYVNNGELIQEAGNGELCSTSSAEDIKQDKKDFQIYPIPGDSILKVAVHYTPPGGFHKLIISDSKGAQVKSMNIEHGTGILNIDISKLKPGVYTLCMQRSNSGKPGCQTFLKM